MNRSIENRLSKLEAQYAPQRLSHEDWIDTLNRAPAEIGDGAGLDAQIEAEALSAFGSLHAAALAARAKAKKSGNPMDDFLAADLEHRAGTLSEGVVI